METVGFAGFQHTGEFFRFFCGYPFHWVSEFINQNISVLIRDAAGCPFQFFAVCPICFGEPYLCFLIQHGHVLDLAFFAEAELVLVQDHWLSFCKQQVLL